MSFYPIFIIDRRARLLPGLAQTLLADSSLSIQPCVRRIYLLLLLLLCLSASFSSAVDAALSPDSPKLSLLLGHTGPVDSVAYSPDGKTLASGSWDNTIKLWDTATGEIKQTLEGHKGGVRSIAFSPDGKTLASGSRDNTIKLWNTDTAELEQTLKGHDSEVDSIAFSPDGKTLASGSEDKTIKFWNTATGELKQTLKGHDNLVYSVAFSPDGKTLASGSRDKTIKLWNTDTGELKQTLKGHDNLVNSVAFSPDGKTLASGSGDKTIKLWNTDTGELKQTLQGYVGSVESVAFSPDGKTLASASEYTTIKLWDMTTGGLKQTLRGHDDSESVAFSPDGKTLASGSVEWVNGPNHGEIKLWDTATGQLKQTLQGHNDVVSSVAFSPDGKTLASGSNDDTIKLWNTDTGELKQTLKGHEGAVYSVAFSPDGKTLASGSDDKTIKLWDAATGELKQTLKGHDDQVDSIAFSPDGKTLASGSDDNTIKLWDAATGNLKQTLKGHNGDVFSLAFSPEGKTLASGSNDKTVKLWDTATGELKQTLQGHDNLVRSVAFSPGGKTLASGSWDSTIKLWRPSDGELLASLLSLPAKDKDSLAADWLALTPEGYYNGSPGSSRLIKWRIGSALFPVESYESTFHRPDLVEKALTGDALPDTAEVQQFTAGNAIPPTVGFVSLQEGQEVTGDSIPVTVMATDPRKVARVEFSVNGRPVLTKALERGAKAIERGAKGLPVDPDGKPLLDRPIPKSHKVAQTYEALLPLPPGDQDVIIKATAYNSQQLQGWEEIHVKHRSVPVVGDLYVLAVGISQYQNPHYNLKFADADARAFAGLWKPMEGKLYQHIYTTTLVNKEATAAGVRGALQQLTERVTNRDSVALFLSGHGVQEGVNGFYFATADVDLDNLEGTALPWSWFQETLVGQQSGRQASRVFLFLDACHAGSSLGSQQAYNVRLAEGLIKHAGVMVFASSRGSQYSYEDDEKGHGAFTEALVEGIGEGKADLEIAGQRNGKITPSKLETYLEARVPQLTGNLQTPTSPLQTDFGEPWTMAQM